MCQIQKGGVFTILALSFYILVTIYILMNHEYVKIKNKKVKIFLDHQLDLSGSHIRDINQIEGLEDLSDLQYLNLSDNNLNELSAFNKFKNLASLKILDLSFNELSRLNFADLTLLTELEVLDLAYNGLRALEEADTLPSLKFLYLDGNLVSFIEGPEYNYVSPYNNAPPYRCSTPAWIDEQTDLPTLQKVSKILTNPRFRQAIRDARATPRGNQVSMRYSDWERAELEFKAEIWNGVLNLSDIIVYDMGRIIESLSENDNFDFNTIIKLKLQNVDLWDMHGINEFPNLQVLDLSKNAITKIEHLDAIPQLRVLNLSRNKISKIEGLENLPNLQELNLSNNQIWEIEGLDHLTNLHYLYLDENPISEIKGLDFQTQLLELDLHGNNIKKIQGLDNLSQLESLYLNHNVIKKIEGLDCLPNLQVLALNHNYIIELEGLDLLTSLRILNLSDNQIREIKGLHAMQNLQHADFHNNPISSEYVAKSSRGIQSPH